MPGEAFGPLHSEQYEVGLKADLWDTRFTVDLAAFQIKRTSEYIDATNTYVQNGRQRHRGVELTARGQPWQPLALNVGLAYLDAVLQNTGDPLTEGARPQNVPKWRATLYADYALPLVAGLYVNTTLLYTGEREVQVPAVDAKGDAYLRWDLGLRYEAKLWHRDVTFRAGVENLIDEQYYLSSSFNLYWGLSGQSLRLVRDHILGRDHGLWELHAWLGLVTGIGRSSSSGGGKGLRQCDTPLSLSIARSSWERRVPSPSPGRLWRWHVSCHNDAGGPPIAAETYIFAGGVNHAPLLHDHPPLGWSAPRRLSVRQWPHWRDHLLGSRTG